MATTGVRSDGIASYFFGNPLGALHRLEAMRRLAPLPVLRSAAIIFLPLAAIAILVMAAIYLDQASRNRTVVQLQQEKAAEVGQREFARYLDELVADVGYLAEGETLARWLGSGAPADLGSLESDFLAFARNKPQYDQVRFIDLTGLEQVRVDHTDSGPVAVLREALQNKAGRPYVSDTLKLHRGELYFSRFDLNVEHGEIEQPIKPMIRVATPVFDANGVKRGMVILNYRGAALLSDLRSGAAQVAGDLWLIDSDGNWMLGPTREDEWAFMYPERSERTFAKAFPQAWARISGAAQGRFDVDGSLFAYARVFAAPHGVAAAVGSTAPLREWYLIAHAAPAALPPILTGSFWLGGGAVLALLAAVSLLAAIYRIRRQQARAEIDLLNRRLAHSEKMEALGQLTGGVAHDFNNLLAVIIGNTEILAECVDDPELKEMAELVMNTAEEGAALTERLLSIGRRQALHPAPLPLGETVDSLEATLHRTLGDGISLMINVGSSHRIQVDRSQFESALVNLALNARAAMPNGGVFRIASEIVSRPETLAEELAPGDTVRVSVSDTGIGMSPETAEHVFDPFFTTKEIGKGAGMGLAMVYGFAKQSGGHAVIESEPMQGTTVHLYLPLAKKEAAKDDQPRAKEAPAPAPMQRVQKVLMAEDEPQLRTQIARQLRELGYSVEEAESGVEALDMLLASPDFDILFTDVVMPGGMSGIDLAQRARQLKPKLKVLLTTGYANASEQQLASIEDPILKKPYRKKGLASALRDLSKAA